MLFTDPSGYRKKNLEEQKMDFMYQYDPVRAFEGFHSSFKYSYSYNRFTNSYSDTNGNWVPYRDVYENYIASNSETISGNFTGSVLQDIADGCKIYHITYKPGNIDAIIFAFGDLGTVTPDASGALNVSNGGYTAGLHINIGEGAVKAVSQSGGRSFEGTRVYALDLFDLKDGAAFTLPGIGIFTGSRYTQNVDLLRHELGHILQAKKWGYLKYYPRCRAIVSRGKSDNN